MFPVVMAEYKHDGTIDHWFLVDKDTGEVLWEQHPSQCEAPREIINYDLVYMELSTKVHFGKYRGHVLKSCIDNNKSYVNYMRTKYGYFKMTDDALKYYNAAPYSEEFDVEAWRINES